MRLICWLNTIWMTLLHGTSVGAIFSGHDYIETQTDKWNPKTQRFEQILTCRRCGGKSISWWK